VSTDTVKFLLAAAALIAICVSAFFIPYAFWLLERHRWTAKNPNWELENEISMYLDWADRLKPRTGFADRPEEARQEFEAAIGAARAALAPESKITAAPALQAIYARLKTTSESIAEALPPSRRDDYDMLIG